MLLASWSWILDPRILDLGSLIQAPVISIWHAGHWMKGGYRILGFSHCCLLYLQYLLWGGQVKPCHIHPDHFRCSSMYRMSSGGGPTALRHCSAAGWYHSLHLIRDANSAFAVICRYYRIYYPKKSKICPKQTNKSSHFSGSKIPEKFANKLENK